MVRRNAKAAIAIVQRKRDKAWVLPKGKIKPNEKPITAAKREATEETGCTVHVYEFLGVTCEHHSEFRKVVRGFL